MKRLLLISNSTLHGGGYLDHCAGELLDFLGPEVRRVLFVPYALHDRDAYAAAARKRFEGLGVALNSVHQAESAIDAIAEAEAVFVGGGNTFRLLSELYRTGLIDAIPARCAGGMPYVGSSAGTNVACATIKTTNDMPIVLPPSFDALGLVPFNVNPHFIDADPGSKHMGETREQRILEFHEENEPPVVGLREGAMLRVEGDEMRLLGSSGARLFRRGQTPVDLEVGAVLDELLRA